MPIVTLLVILAIIGVLVWLVNTYIPMAEPWKKAFNVIAIIATVLWLLNVFGIWDMGGTVGHLHTHLRD